MPETRGKRREVIPGPLPGLAPVTVRIGVGSGGGYCNIGRGKMPQNRARGGGWTLSRPIWRAF